MKRYTFFKNKPQPVLKEAANRRKEIDDFIIALTRRIQIQQSYARNLFNVGKSMEKYTKDETRISCSVFSAFQLSNQNRGMQAYAFCKSLKQQVLKKLKDLHYDQCLEARALQKEVKKLEQQLNESLDYARKIKHRYQDIEKDYEESLMTNEVLQILVSTPEDKKLKSKNKYNDMYQEITLHKENYMNAENQYNILREKYYQDVEKLLIVLEKHELQRLSIQIDSVMKTLVFETSMIKNFEYDIKKVTKKIGEKEIKNDIINFVERNDLLKNERIYTVLDECKNHNIFRQTIYQMTSNRYIKQKMEFEKSVTVKKFLQKKIKKEDVLEIEGIPTQKIKSYNFLIEITRKSLVGEEINQVDFGKFRAEIQEDQKRHLIYKYLIEYQFNSHFKLNQQAFNKTFNIIEEILMKCLAKKEMFLVRKLINLTFYYYLEPDAKKDVKKETNNKYKTYLFVKLIGREQLKSEELWSTIIYSSIQDELNSIVQKIPNKEEAKMIQASTIFSQLAQHSHHIMMLGIPLKTIKKIISKFCRVYSLNEQTIKDISKCLAGAFVQFKQKYCPQDMICQVKLNSLNGDQFNLC